MVIAQIFWKICAQYLILRIMKKFTSILLLSFMMIPIFWNAMSFVHYLVEHTHTFCTNKQDHQHSSSDDCFKICNITQHHDQGQVPLKVEFYELKQYITPFSSFKTPIKFTNQLSSFTNYSSLYGRVILEDVFRPPIS